MRYPPEHKELTRQRIIAAAARAFRERGPDGVGLPEIMRRAGLTIGGFYRHFESKDELFREAFASALGDTTERLRGLPDELHGPEWMRRAAAAYLQSAHRHNVASGCPLPALAADVVRQGAPARASYQENLNALIDAIADRVEGDPAAGRPRAWSFLATLVGGLTLARGVEDEELANEILDACQTAAGGPVGDIE